MSPIAATHTISSDQLTLAALALLLPFVTTRMMRSMPGVRPVRIFIRRVPDFVPTQPRSVAVGTTLVSGYLGAATAAKH